MGNLWKNDLLCIVFDHVCYIPTKEEKASKNPRISCSSEDQERKTSNCSSTGERKKTIGRITPKTVFSYEDRVHSEEFEEVLKKGKMIHSPLFSLSVLKNSKKAYAVVASKKVSKKAVVRNKNKRRVRHALKKITTSLPTASYIVFIKKDLTAISYTELTLELSKLCERAAVL